MDVDHVYTWVNTADADFLDERARLADAEVREDRAYRSGDARIADHGELRASLTAAGRFLPFVRRTIIVGAGKRPDWLDAFANVEYIEQASFIPPAVWPTYQSDVVEAYIHQIPGLAERYIYSNDDFFFSRSHVEADFFNEQGQAKVGLAPYHFGTSPTAVYHAWNGTASAR